MKDRLRFVLILEIHIILGNFPLFGQDKEIAKDGIKILDLTSGPSIKLTTACQFWTVYTMSQKADVDNDDRLDAVDDRLDFFLRRARFWIKGNIINCSTTERVDDIYCRSKYRIVK